MTESEYIVRFAGIPWQSAETGVRFKARLCGEQQLRLLELTSELAHPEW